jgi:DNA polymerase-3 subunit epsilon
LARVGNQEIDTLEALAGYSRAATPVQRAKRHLIDAVPHAPGVYIFRAEDERPLYIGTSGDLRTRVRSYFTGSEPRARMRDMIALTERVDAIECAHALEAQVRELRLIAAHKPPYNQRDKYPERATWLTLTQEPYPRVALTRTLHPERIRVGPFRSTSAAKSAELALYEALPLRQCRTRLDPARASPRCALADMGRCGAACQQGESVAEYSVHVQALRRASTQDPGELVDALFARIDALSATQRFEAAALLRDQTAQLLRGLVRGQRLTAFTEIEQLVAVAPAPTGGGDLIVVRRGRLAAAARCDDAAAIPGALRCALATAESATESPGRAAHPSESERLLTWLTSRGARLLEITGPWTSPVRGAERFGDAVRQLDDARPAFAYGEGR